MECGCDDMRGSGRESMGKAITKDSVFDSMRRVEAALKLRSSSMMTHCVGQSHRSSTQERSTIQEGL